MRNLGLLSALGMLSAAALPRAPEIPPDKLPGFAPDSKRRGDYHNRCICGRIISANKRGCLACVKAIEES